MSEEEAYKIFSEMTPDVLDYVFCLAKAYTEKEEEIEKLNKKLQLISDEFLKYDWETSSKGQTINQLKSLYYSIFKGGE